MKELLEKFLGLFSEGVEKMEKSNTEEAIKKFKEASEMSQSLKKKAEETDEVNLKKFLENEGQETLRKYVDMYLSAQDVSSFIKEVKELAGTTEMLAKKIDEFNKQKENDDELLSKTLDETIDRVEELEKTLETTISRIS